MTLTLPELSFVVLIGVSGSGKSTFARKHFKPTEILSSDCCRGLVSDDEKAAEWWHQADTGGGALLDYCCYGACLAAWLLPEQPLTVQCLMANLKSRYGDAEDNAAKTIVKKPVAAYVEKVYELADFSGLGLGA